MLLVLISIGFISRLLSENMIESEFFPARLSGAKVK